METESDLRRASADLPETTGRLGSKPHWRRGVLLGILGVLAFSGTLPATRVAVPELGPAMITFGRIEVAALLGLLTLLLTRQLRVPNRRHWAGILWTGLGLAVGYPLFIALAMRDVPAAHGAVVIGLAPAVTALVAVIRVGERPPLRFWIASAVGVGAVLVFALDQGGGSVSLADGWLVLAMLSVGVAYVEGGRVSRELGGATTLCWAMIVLAPLAAIPFGFAIWQRDWAIPVSAGVWIGFWYAGIVSMFLGSVAWYRGLAAGGIARIGQLNLLQPLLALLWSALLIGERVTGIAVACALIVVGAMIVCLRSRIPIVSPST